MNYTKLNYDGYEEYLVGEGEILIFGGLAYEFKFDNNFGASVIKHSGSYGNQEDLFELAVLYDGCITYTSGITDDVIGWLKNDDVLFFLEEIKSLKSLEEEM